MPLQWQFFGGPEEDKVYILKLPVLYIIVDTKFHDKLCGRVTSQEKMNHLCSYFNVERDDTDNPYCEFEYTKIKNKNYVNWKGDHDRLKEELAMYLISNA